MIAEIGHFALILALCVAVVQATVPLYGAWRGTSELMAVGRPAAQAQFGLTLLSFAALVYVFATSDFSVKLVAGYSHTAQPMLYKFSSVWGNHEGSMLLWVLILTLFGAAVATFGKTLPDGLRARVLGIHGLIGVGFLAFVVLTSNPFERLSPVPFDGNDLNPLLQDPGLAFHPPFLYLGYVGFSMAFSFAIAALMEGRVDAAWARWVRPWTLVAWSSLTLGIGLGSWWAYYELGWGGWWFWDPTENASFMPWLAGTALLHSLIAVEKRGALKNWTMLLAIITFSMSLIGTFLVRSGVIQSVHSFASDPSRGVFILFLLLLTIGGSLLLYFMRAPGLKGGEIFTPISREGGLVLNNVVLSGALGVVLIGTLYPLVIDILGAGKISVGAPFFNSTFGPLMVPLLLAVPVGVLLSWKRGRIMTALGRMKVSSILTFLTMTLAWYLVDDATILSLLGIGLAAWIFFGTLTEFADRIKLFRVSPGVSWKRAINLPRSAWGMTIAHSGLGILVAGIIAMSAWRVEHVEVVPVGGTMAVGEYTMQLDDVSSSVGPNYQALIGKMRLFSDGEEISTLTPEKRFYPIQQMPTTEAATYSHGGSDFYVVLGDENANGEWPIWVFFNPLASWLWAGALLMALGGLVSLTDRRLRIGAPNKRRMKNAVPEAAE